MKKGSLKRPLLPACCTCAQSHIKSFCLHVRQVDAVNTSKLNMEADFHAEENDCD